LRGMLSLQAGRDSVLTKHPAKAAQ